jgi:WD40 repeat protein
MFVNDNMNTARQEKNVGVDTAFKMEMKSFGFELCDIKCEEKQNRKLYGIRFCDIVPQLWHYCATVGANSVSIYKVIMETKKLELVQRFVDSSEKKSKRTTQSAILHPKKAEEQPTNPTEGHTSNSVNDEELYSCTWAWSQQDQPLVVAAGKLGVLKVINLITSELCALVGHGGAINELRTHVLDPGIVFSASRDRSVRMWNVRTMVCIAIFGGDGAHKFEILSLDIHPLGNCFASSSMDTSINIWNLQDPKLIEAIQNSDDADIASSKEKSIDVVVQSHPLFSTTRIHTDYVDCVRWVGDFLLTKSTNNRIVLWSPDAQRYKVRFVVVLLIVDLNTLDFIDCLECTINPSRVQCL